MSQTSSGLDTCIQTCCKWLTGHFFIRWIESCLLAPGFNDVCLLACAGLWTPSLWNVTDHTGCHQDSPPKKRIPWNHSRIIFLLKAVDGDKKRLEKSRALCLAIARLAIYIMYCLKGRLLRYAKGLLPTGVEKLLIMILSVVERACIYMYIYIFKVKATNLVAPW